MRACAINKLLWCGVNVTRSIRGWAVNFQACTLNELSLGRWIKIHHFRIFGRETHLFRNGKSKEELLRNAQQFQQWKSSINGEEIVLQFVVLSTR